MTLRTIARRKSSDFERINSSRSSFRPLTLAPSGNSASASIGCSVRFSRRVAPLPSRCQLPTASYSSNAMPQGSILRWQLMQDGTVAMDGERLRDRQVLQLRLLAVEFRHIRRRGRGRVVEQIPEQPDAALDRMAVLAVREAGEDAGVRQDAAAVEALVELAPCGTSGP